MSRRGTTGTGRPAAIPSATYDPPKPAQRAAAGWVINFAGEDGRSGTFALDRWPLHGWHDGLASALGAALGPGGRCRTLASARAVWYLVGQFVKAIAEMPNPPATPGHLDVEHVRVWHQQRVGEIGSAYAWSALREIGRLLASDSLRSDIADSAFDYTQRLNDGHWPASTPGYSNREVRLLMRAARRDVAALRNRIHGSEVLLAQFRDNPDALNPDQRHRGELLNRMASSGNVSWPAGSLAQKVKQRHDLASQLFVTVDDIPPLLILGVALTGRNVETIKELPAQHRIIDGRAVEVQTIKRRRGQQNWHETVTWEIGRPGRELHAPGGFYLLLAQLTRRSRQFCGTPGVWAIWRPGHGLNSVDEHRGIFDHQLGLSGGRNGPAAMWVARHGLTADAIDGEDADNGSALHLDFKRLRTSIEARRTRQLGGHLPSATRSNTLPVLFRNYLRGDPTIVAWAHEILSEAVVDAEQSALAAHRRALEASTNLSIPKLLSDDTQDADDIEPAAAQPQETGWTTCVDHDHHPITNQRCTASFLDCFHCGNCLITAEHLPALLSLLQALAKRRERLSEQEWWIRYGMAWAAIRHDVLTKFSPQEVEHAAVATPVDDLLDLVEMPWEQP